MNNPLFPGLPDPTNLADVFRQFPIGVLPLLQYHDQLLRAETRFKINYEVISTLV